MFVFGCKNEQNHTYLSVIEVFKKQEEMNSFRTEYLVLKDHVKFMQELMIHLEFHKLCLSLDLEFSEMETESLKKEIQSLKMTTDFLREKVEAYHKENEELRESIDSLIHSQKRLMAELKRLGSELQSMETRYLNMKRDRPYRPSYSNRGNLKGLMKKIKIFDHTKRKK